MTTIEIKEGENKSVALVQLSRKDMAESGVDIDQ